MKVWENAFRGQESKARKRSVGFNLKKLFSFSNKNKHKQNNKSNSHHHSRLFQKQTHCLDRRVFDIRKLSLWSILVMIMDQLPDMIITENVKAKTYFIFLHVMWCCENKQEEQNIIRRCEMERRKTDGLFWLSFLPTSTGVCNLSCLFIYLCLFIEKGCTRSNHR